MTTLVAFFQFIPEAAWTNVPGWLLGVVALVSVSFFQFRKLKELSNKKEDWLCVRSAEELGQLKSSVGENTRRLTDLTLEVRRNIDQSSSAVKSVAVKITKLENEAKNVKEELKDVEDALSNTVRVWIPTNKQDDE